MTQQLYKLTYVKNRGGVNLLILNDDQERMTKGGLYECYKTQIWQTNGISAACGNFGTMPFAGWGGR